MPTKPEWLRVPYADNENSSYVTELLKELKLNTVCTEASCPNRGECFSNKTATFMILGNICTRKCTFCNVRFGTPDTPDKDEAKRIAAAVLKLQLRYVVITSVTRDDLPDGGAFHFSEVIKAIRKSSPETAVEVLIPDLTGPEVITAKSPAVISHNIETVKSLYETVRPGADYKRSLKVLRTIKEQNPKIYTKSGLMLGLGESENEISEAFDDLLKAGCDFLTIGQYLSPGKNHLPVLKYIEPSEFEKYGKTALETGFKHVESAPLVRSSYFAHRALGITNI
ncbi:MAG: lipoyl synthase [Oscillospiraceae bacterium]|nr:lipoyl synthase [Oscillospiraceae bacterium]